MKNKYIGITIGDPSGVGPEIVLKALTAHPDLYRDAIPLVFGDPNILQLQAGWFGIKTDIITIDHPSAIGESGPEHVYVIPVSQEQHIPEFGKVNGISGKLAFRYIEAATNAALKGDISAIATAPINKEALRQGSVPFLDHTEIFTRLTHSEKTMTLFMTGPLKVFFYSRHLAFKDIVKALDRNKLVETLVWCRTYLEQIGFGNPRLALAALNPHGGEQGMFGDEEISILAPAVREAAEKGIRVDGPVPADSVFHLAITGMYDGVLSLYHDQGHIAAKTYDFHRTISLTMGLPFLRTSVDHGTAMDLAGKNSANETSMVEAIKAASRYGW